MRSKLRARPLFSCFSQFGNPQCLPCASAPSPWLTSAQGYFFPSLPGRLALCKPEAPGVCISRLKFTKQKQVPAVLTTVVNGWSNAARNYRFSSVVSLHGSASGDGRVPGTGSLVTVTCGALGKLAPAGDVYTDSPSACLFSFFLYVASQSCPVSKRSLLAPRPDTRQEAEQDIACTHPVLSFFLVLPSVHSFDDKGAAAQLSGDRHWDARQIPIKRFFRKGGLGGGAWAVFVCSLTLAVHNTFFPEKRSGCTFEADAHPHPNKGDHTCLFGGLKAASSLSWVLSLTGSLLKVTLLSSFE
ncbi:hypothetical protein NDU88_007091 [Pleurodeles waltl]|uniref:Transmembrane protein n=1 Tax=Pleurodeles waltl TaxID=8319 RepID=A0AAV7NTV4_PLEWA|nr:hypothetical protein NDU88_007091 [Pleurodeles waltl]